MNTKLIQPIEEQTKKELNQKIAIQCAPLLMGIKISNIFIVDQVYEEQVYALFEETTISVRQLHTGNGRITFLLYVKEKVEAYLHLDCVTDCMEQLGYEFLDLDDVLEQTAKRFTSYMEDRISFPHELGILLGYPAKDVLGFIKHEGKDYLYSGYWKVYDDLEEALKTFEQYKESKKIITNMIAFGVSMEAILRMYHKNPSYEERSKVFYIPSLPRNNRFNPRIKTRRYATLYK